MRIQATTSCCESPGAAPPAAGIHSGELLVATEGGALTDAVSPTANRCHVRLVAHRPSVAQAEGDIALASLEAH